ncbi:MAG: hypothetical protein ACI81G_000577 [Gammaproteobacteria bacterium]|jgi:hypothetical protein
MDSLFIGLPSQRIELNILVKIKQYPFNIFELKLK